MNVVVRPLLTLLLICACGGDAPPPTVAPDGGGAAAPAQVDYWLQTNLHPDASARRLYSTNYQQTGLIPRCSKVTVLDVTEKVMHFTVVDAGITYEYLFQPKTMNESVEKHLARYFGPECVEDPLMTEADRKGIAEGKAAPGMSKAGVIKALGYPPAHATPTTEGDLWRYWRNRFDTFNVTFQDGIVTGVQN